MALYDKKCLPGHVAIIMDGNGRWAAKRGLPRGEGHKAGARAVRGIVEECRVIGIPCLTLYAFSRENWNRPPAEIATLFGLLLDFLALETPRMVDQGISLRVIGDLDGMPAAQKAALRLAISRTAQGREMRLNLALNYGARAEIIQAVKRIMEKGLQPDEITEELFSSCLYTQGLPEPDLIIRTSGELRLSNFLLFQAAYSELYFTNVLWPDFDRQELHKALADFTQRQRRYGLTEEQLCQRGEKNGR